MMNDDRSKSMQNTMKMAIIVLKVVTAHGCCRRRLHCCFTYYECAYNSFNWNEFSFEKQLNKLVAVNLLGASLQVDCECEFCAVHLINGNDSQFSMPFSLFCEKL